MRVPHIAGCQMTPPTIGCPGCIHAARPRPAARRRARTSDQRAMLNAGIHPATGLNLDHAHTCGECAKCSAITFAAASTRYKCDEHLAGRLGSHTDIRLSWPACSSFVSAVPVNVSP